MNYVEVTVIPKSGKRAVTLPKVSDQAHAAAQVVAAKDLTILMDWQEEPTIRLSFVHKIFGKYASRIAYNGAGIRAPETVLEIMLLEFDPADFNAWLKDCSGVPNHD